MKHVILTAASSLLIAAGAATANAAQTPAVDAGPVIQNSQAMEAADTLKPMNMRQQIESQLTTAGYKNVLVTPSSFYVRATDQQGNPMAMVIGPDSFMEVTEKAPKAPSSSSTMDPSSTAPATKP